MSSAFNLSAAHLQLWRGERHVLRDVSFMINGGEALHVKGANGAGKTTLLRVVCGLLQPEAGQVQWNGTDTGQHRDEFLSSLAYLGHDTGLKGDLTALENLRYSAGLRHSIPPARMTEALASLDVVDCAHLPCRVLSAGQRRRIALCRILLSDARLWVLDEPFTNLDAASSARISAALDAHLAQEGLALIAAHQGLALSRPVRSLELA